MLITRIELKDTKSYRDQSVTFAEGTNAICGQNGAGKSTLLEAIGFTLFDHLPNTQTNFVREGERTATVTAHFVSSADSREYQVVRKCGGSSDYFVYDPELKGRIVSGRVDVLDWLRQQMGVEPATDLRALFRDAIGVPQGLLTAAFLQTPALRKPTFDRLLQVDDYERVYKDLLDTVHHLRAEIGAAEVSMAGLRSRAARLPGLQETADTLRTELAANAGRLGELAATLDEVTLRRREIEAIRLELDGLRQEVGQHETRLQSSHDQIESAQQAVIQSEQAQAAQESSRAGYTSYQAAQEALQATETERRQRDRLREQEHAQERARDLALADVQRLESDLEELARTTDAMGRLEPQVRLQAQLEKDLQAQRELQVTLEMTAAQADDVRSQLEEAQSRLAGLEEGLLTAQRLEGDLLAARTWLEETRATKPTITSQQATVKAEAERLKKQTGDLEAADAASCPVCEQPLTPSHRDELLARNRNQIEALRTQYKALNGEAAGIESREKELDRACKELEARLRELPRPAERDEAVARLGRLQAQLTTAQEAASQLADVQAEVTSLERRLVELADPRREYDRLALRAAERDRVEKGLATQRARASTAEAVLAGLQPQLLGYADLDRRLEALRARLAQHEADYRRYLHNSQLAADLPTRRQRVEALLAQQAALEKKVAELGARLAEVSGRFDPDELATTTQREEALKREQATLQGKHDVQQRQLAGIEREVEDLTAAQGALAAQQAAVEETRNLVRTTEFLREVIRKAGPHVVHRVAQQVSLQASRLFGAVMADYTARLHWQDDYGIVLETGGRRRDFEQLSGGEQMAAALAIRLALLRELSSIDVAFFDEPTSNLDSTRRDNLAEQILAVKDAGFSQLFVISHDDTFEQVTNHVVRVRKERGESFVEVG